MKNKPILENHYGVNVWINSTTENIRREECLCLHCMNMCNCPTASRLYEICCSEDIAFIMTRCKKYILN